MGFGLVEAVPAHGWGVGLERLFKVLSNLKHSFCDFMQQNKGLPHEYPIRGKAGISRRGDSKALITICIHQPNFL